MPLLRRGGLAAGAVLLVACSGPPNPTTNCAPFIAKRVEATVTFPQAVVFKRDAHEGLGSTAPFTSGDPWAVQDVGVDAPEGTVFAWYSKWLTAHGWNHVRDQHPTDSTGLKVSDVSDWEHGDEAFSVIVDVSASGRSHFPLSPNQLLVSTTYSAPGGVLGCH